MKLTFKGTKTIYEHEYLCKLNGDEFNQSLNVSLYNNKKVKIDKFTTDEFTPYITKIGLYNEDGILLAVGKFSKPMKKLKNVDMNIIVKYDN